MFEARLGCETGMELDVQDMPQEWVEKEYNRIMKHVVVQPECWDWTATFSNGYPRFRFMGRMQMAHRVLYALVKGPIPEGMVVRHTCDNSRCINPEHLVLGTQRENMADRERRGRNGNMGEKSPWARLTAEEVVSIRERYAAGGITLKELGLMHGVSQNTIHAIVTGFSWKHVGGPLTRRRAA